MNLNSLIVWTTIKFKITHCATVSGNHGSKFINKISCCAVVLDTYQEIFCKKRWTKFRESTSTFLPKNIKLSNIDCCRFVPDESRVDPRKHPRRARGQRVGGRREGRGISRRREGQGRRRGRRREGRRGEGRGPHPQATYSLHVPAATGAGSNVSEEPLSWHGDQGGDLSLD